MDGSAWEHQMSYALNCARMHFVQCRNEADLQGGEIQSFWYLMDTSKSMESYWWTAGDIVRGGWHWSWQESSSEHAGWTNTVRPCSLVGKPRNGSGARNDSSNRRLKVRDKMMTISSKSSSISPKGGSSNWGKPWVPWWTSRVRIRSEAIFFRRWS